MSVFYYRVQADVCPEQLASEINDDIGGTPFCEYVRIDDLVNLTISFDNALSAPEESSMDAVILSHVCENPPTDPEGNEIGSGLSIENDSKPLSGDVSIINFEGCVAVVPDPNADMSTAIVHIGHTEVTNNSGATITENTPVYATGYDSVNGRTYVAAADALIEAKMPSIGLLEGDLANGENGLAVVSGETHGSDTSAFNVGDRLWVAPGGGLTTSRPDNGSQVQKLGQVVSVDNADGKIFVSGAGRVNDLPNLTSNKVWMGDANDLAIEVDIYTEAEVDALLSGIGGDFGNGFQEISNDGASSTTSTSYLQKLRLTTTNLASGKYRIGFYCESRNNNTSSRTDVRIQLNDTTTLANPSLEAEDSDDYAPFAGFEYVNLSGVNTIDLDYRKLEGGGNACVRRARLEIWRVS